MLTNLLAKQWFFCCIGFQEPLADSDLFVNLRLFRVGGFVGINLRDFV